MVYIIAAEKTILLSIIVTSQGCCIKININLYSYANKKSMNNAVAPQSAITMLKDCITLID